MWAFVICGLVAVGLLMWGVAAWTEKRMRRFYLPQLTREQLSKARFHALAKMTFDGLAPRLSMLMTKVISSLEPVPLFSDETPNADHFRTDLDELLSAVRNRLTRHTDPAERKNAGDVILSHWDLLTGELPVRIAPQSRSRHRVEFLAEASRTLTQACM